MRNAQIDDATSGIVIAGTRCKHMKIDPQSNWNNAIDSNSREALSRSLRGEESARDYMTALVDAAIDGRFDPEFAGNPDPQHVHVTTSCHLMVLKFHLVQV